MSSGQIVDQSPELAFRYLRDAADFGHTEAQYEVTSFHVSFRSLLSLLHRRQAKKQLRAWSFTVLSLILAGRLVL